MQFMQRAVAASPSVSVSATPDSHSSKRRKLSASPSPNTPQTDHERVQAALAEEESRRQKALEKQALDAGETKWVLSFQDDSLQKGARQGLRVVPAGFASLDRPGGLSTYRDHENWREPVVGRKVFGGFKGVNVSLALTNGVWGRY